MVSQIHPFAPVLAGTPQAQRLAAADRDAQLRRTAQKQHTSGYAVEQQDEYVESADAIQPSGEREHQQHQAKRQPKKQGEEPADDVPHIDVQA